MFSRVRTCFEGSRLARMSSGHYCIIRDLGLVKGGKGLRHHEVVLDLSWRGLWLGLFRAVKSVLPQAWKKISPSSERDASASVGSERD
jgi:hypothetical protein